MLRFISFGVVVALAAALSACGSTQEQAESIAFAEWQERVCTLTAEYEDEDAADSEPPDDSELFSAESDRRELESMKSFLDDLRAIPLPDEKSEDAERFVETYATMVERYEDSLPRIEDASRRLGEAIDSIDPDTMTMPDEDETVAGSIMDQVLANPEAKDAWDDMMREYAGLTAGMDEGEFDRLSAGLGVGDCEESSG